ncbi:MAG: DUF4864 domain-containing protein [Silicimonas sp.]|nr:DUF4864 domain-containing protein [Silicimonas sp.]
MRNTVHSFLVMLCLGWPFSLSAQDVMQPDPGIEATIGSQIEAFLMDDFATAFTFASPNIQGLFGDHERFGQMVRNGYPMVWRPGDVEYLELRQESGALWQRVLIRDQKGGVHMLDYQMIQTGDGWRINGVQLLRQPGVSA